MLFYDFWNFKCKNITVKNSVSEKLVGVIMDNKPDFTYCPFVWMFCYREIMHKMNKTHRQSLHLLLKNYRDDFQDL